MAAIPGSATYPGVRQRIQVQLGPSSPGENERILLIGYRDSLFGDEFDNVPQRVLTADDAIQLFGEGSQLALMARAAFAVGPLARLDSVRGFVPEIWCEAIEPPVDTIGGDLAAVFTGTLAGTATANAQMPIEVGNESGFISVVNGDTAAAVAAKVNTFILGIERNLPATTGVLSAVVTLTARELGAHVNEMFFWLDDRRVPGITATIAQSVVGVGLVDVAPALTASEGGDWAVVVLPQQDTTTRDLIPTHLSSMWDENTQRRRRVIMPHGGLLTAAATDAQAIDDWRAIVANLERRVGVGIPWAPAQSSRSFSWEGAAALAARLESQLQANWNFNTATLPTRGRPSDTLTGAEYDAAHQAGVSIITDDPQGRAPGMITDPITTATTDQTGVTPAVDRTFLPAEIARVVRQIAALHAIKDAGFAQATSVADSQTQLDIKSAGLTVLNQAVASRWIRPVSDADVSVIFVTEGGSEVAERTETYYVVVGLDIIRIVHLVNRARGGV